MMETVVETRKTVGWENKLALAFVVFVLASTYANASARKLYTGIEKPVKEILCALWEAFVYITIAAAALVVVVAGVTYVVSHDNPGKRKQAISWIIHAVIGLIVIAVAKAIVEGTGMKILSCATTSSS